MSSDQEKQIPIPSPGESILGGMTENKIVLGVAPNMDLRAPGMLDSRDLSSGSVPLSDVPESIQRAWANGDRRDIEIARLRGIRRYQMERATCALHFYLHVEINRVYFNYWHQNWNTKSDPGIDGIIWRAGQAERYPSPKTPEHYYPNFEFDGIAVWWKLEPAYPMFANVNYGADPWYDWFNKCHEHILSWEREHDALPTPCICAKIGCPTENGWGCKGECGCRACSEAYSDFLSDDR